VTILFARETDLDGGACARVVGDDPEVIHQHFQTKKRGGKIAGFGQMRRCDIGDDAFDGQVWPVEGSRCCAGMAGQACALGLGVSSFSACRVLCI
jgi:hypothetical protein